MSSIYWLSVLLLLRFSAAEEMNVVVKKNHDIIQTMYLEENTKYTYQILTELVNTYSPNDIYYRMKYNNDKFEEYPIFSMLIRLIDPETYANSEAYAGTITFAGQQLILLFINNGADIEAIGYNNRTLLHRAILMGHYWLVEELLKHHAKIPDGMLEAVDNSKDWMPKFLFNKYVNPSIPVDTKKQRFDITNMPTGRKVFIYVSNLLLKYSANNIYFQNQPIMFTIIRLEDTNAFSALLENGVDINTINDSGRTALHIAVLNKKYWFVEELLKNKAKTDIKDNDGLTPMDLCMKDHDSKMKALFDKYSALELLSTSIKSNALTKAVPITSDPKIAH